MKRIWIISVLFTMGLAFYSCKEDNPVLPENNPDTPQPEDAKNISEKSDFESYIDMDTYAGDDFYQYAVGKWLQNNPLKGTKMSNGTVGDMVAAMEAFINSQALNSEDEVLKRLNSDFSASTKDADLALLKQKLADIYAISSVDDMYKKMGELMFDGYQTPFMFTCISKERCVRPYLKQVFDELDASSSHFEEYAGISETEANLIVNVIERWMNECWQKAEAESNKMSHYLKELNVVEVSFPKTRAGATSPLETILTSMGLTSNDIKLLADKDYKNYDAFLSKLSLDDLKRFSVYMVLNRDLRFIPYDSQRDYMTSFVNLTLGSNNPLAIRLSRIYNKKIPAANRAAAITMANNLRETFKERMNKLPWMSAETRAKAIEKLDNMITMIGWPDDDSRREEWMVKVPSVPAGGKASFYTDVLDLYKQKGKIIISMLNSEKSEDLFYANEMETASYTPNAFYSPINNDFIIMSCNLIAPAFDPTRNDAINYAVLGASTIGHEMTHGFDPNGKKYNKVGKLEEWMAPADSKAFDALTEKMIAHFNKQTYGDYQCNGKQTVTENTADLGGLYIGYDAFMKLLANKGVTGEELDCQGREFFRAFAYGWMGNRNIDYIRLISNDFHAFEPVRVNGNVYLMDEFYRLFNIKSGKRYLAPADRIEIW